MSYNPGPWSVSTASADDAFFIPRQRRQWKFLPNKGRRTARELAWSAVPARTTIVVAVIALCLSAFMHAVNSVFPSPRLSIYAHTFEVLPLWVLIGGSLHQVAARVVQALDDFNAWRASR